MDAGGLTAGAADYRVTASMASGGYGQSADYTLRSGYAGQLDLTQVYLTAAPLILDENTATQLTATLVTDSGASTPLAPAAVSWTILSGPLSSVSSGGLAGSGPVYENTPASLRAVSGGVTGAITLTVRDVSPDNFPPFAADGLPDTWQVSWFGSSGAPSGLHDDPDGDGLDNLTEYATGSDPLHATGVLSYFGPQSGGGTLLTPGLPLLRDAGGSWPVLFMMRTTPGWPVLDYEAQFSADMVQWENAAVSAPLTTEADWSVLRAEPAAGAGPRSFFRLILRTLP